MRVETGPRSAFDCGLFAYVSLEEEIASANAPYTFQGVLRVLEVVEHSVEENEVESTEASRLEIINIHQEGCRVGLASGLDNIETAYRIRERIDADHFPGPALFGLEGEEPFGASDIEDAQSGQVFGQSEVGQSFCSRVAPARAVQSRENLHFLEP